MKQLFGVLLLGGLIVLAGCGKGHVESAGDEVVYKPLTGWDFTGDEAQAWRWMAAVEEEGEAGVGLRVKQHGPVMRLDNLKQRALDVTTVELSFSYEDEGGGKTPQGLRLYWARAADTEGGSSWPFSNERSAPFEAIAGGEGDRWRADIAFHGNWIGTITALFVEVTLPKSAAESGGLFTVKELVFMEEIWQTDDELIQE